MSSTSSLSPVVLQPSIMSPSSGESTPDLLSIFDSSDHSQIPFYSLPTSASPTPRIQHEHLNIHSTKEFKASTGMLVSSMSKLGPVADGTTRILHGEQRLNTPACGEQQSYFVHDLGMRLADLALIKGPSLPNVTPDVVFAEEADKTLTCPSKPDSQPSYDKAIFATTHEHLGSKHPQGVTPITYPLDICQDPRISPQTCLIANFALSQDTPRKPDCGATTLTDLALPNAALNQDGPPPTLVTINVARGALAVFGGHQGQIRVSQGILPSRSAAAPIPREGERIPFGHRRSVSSGYSSAAGSMYRCEDNRSPLTSNPHSSSLGSEVGVRYHPSKFVDIYRTLFLGNPFSRKVPVLSASDDWHTMTMLFDTGSDQNFIPLHLVHALGFGGDVTAVEPFKCSSLSGHNIELTGYIGLRWKSRHSTPCYTEFWVTPDENRVINEIILGAASITALNLFKFRAFGSRVIPPRQPQVDNAAGLNRLAYQLKKREDDRRRKEDIDRAKASVSNRPGKIGTVG